MINDRTSKKTILELLED